MTDPDYFEAMYADSDDPWGLSSRTYERRKYAVTMASLPCDRYRSCFEPGCSIGVLTAFLAARCDRVLAWDGAGSAVQQARHRLGGMEHVRVQQARVPASWPTETFDLIVVSELMYFLSADDREATTRLALASLVPGGHLMAVDWRHPFAAAPSNGDEVHRELTARCAAAGLLAVVDHVEDTFRLQVFAADAPAEMAS